MDCSLDILDIVFHPEVYPGFFPEDPEAFNNRMGVALLPKVREQLHIASAKHHFKGNFSLC